VRLADAVAFVSTMENPMPFRSLVPVSLVVAIVALAGGIHAQAPAKPALDPAALIAQLQATTAPWTAGDLEAFIAPYDTSSTFMTREGPIGRDAMRAHYQKVFFAPGGGKPRPLRFERLEVRALGGDHALMTGRFVLGGDGKPDQSGWFTLVWARTPGGWRILHDHSS
jgi:ketosteroid isomerase-like protein